MSFIQLMCLKNTWSLMSCSPFSPQPKRLAGCLVKNWKYEKSNVKKRLAWEQALYLGEACSLTAPSASYNWRGCSQAKTRRHNSTYQLLYWEVWHSHSSPQNGFTIKTSPQYPNVATRHQISEQNLAERIWWLEKPWVLRAKRIFLSGKLSRCQLAINSIM